MRKRMIILALFGAGVWLTGARWILAQSPLPDLEKTEALRREIRLINLLNGLDLTPEQMAFIRDKAEESRRLRDEARARASAGQDELGSILAEIRRLRMENRDVPRDLAQRFHALDAEIRKERQRIEEARRGLAADIERSLDRHQTYALETFVPCVIPPPGAGRIGQAVDIKGFGGRLERLRAAPERLYARRRSEIIAKSVEEIKIKAGPMAFPSAESELAGKLGDYFDRVRGFRQVDFEVQKEKLAEEFAALVKPTAPALDLAKKIEAFLLAPEVIPILNERLQAARTGR